MLISSGTQVRTTARTTLLMVMLVLLLTRVVLTWILVDETTYLLTSSISCGSSWRLFIGLLWSMILLLLGLSVVNCSYWYREGYFRYPGLSYNIQIDDREVDWLIHTQRRIRRTLNAILKLRVNIIWLEKNYESCTSHASFYTPSHSIYLPGTHSSCPIY